MTGDPESPPARPRGSAAHPPWLPHPALSGASYSAAELASSLSRVFLLDQRELPKRVLYVDFTTAIGVASAIQSMIVRGAPAIGIAAAYGMVLATGTFRNEDAAGYLAAMQRSAKVLADARPTAVNLRWAVGRMLAQAETLAHLSADDRCSSMARLARQIHRQDVEACRAMGKVGAARLPDTAAVLTHCNAGALATGGYGTALGVIRAAVESGKRISVLADETRPYLQGARLTAWELQQDGIPVEVIADSMAAHFMKRGEVSAVVVGADRIARNGDVANKIGTYALACLARAHTIPFYVAAPWSTIDLETESGDAIPIEERSRAELARIGRSVIVPDGVRVRHPAFDVTPAELVTAIFTERGEFSPRDLCRA